jgi:hypothetical protein
MGSRVEWKKNSKKIGKMKRKRLLLKCGGSNRSLIPHGKKFQTRRESYGN